MTIRAGFHMPLFRGRLLFFCTDLLATSGLYDYHDIDCLLSSVAVMSDNINSEDIFTSA